MSGSGPPPIATEGPPAVVPAYTAQRHTQPHTPPTQYDVVHSPHTGYYHPENWQPHGQFVSPGPPPGPPPLMQQYPGPPPLMHSGPMYSAVPQPYPVANGIPAPVNCPPPPPPGNYPHGNFPVAHVPYGTYSAPQIPQGSYPVQQSSRGYHPQASGPGGHHSQAPGPRGLPPHNQYAAMNGGHRDPAVPRRMPNSAPRRNPPRNGSNQHYKPTSHYPPQNQRAPPPPPSLDDFPPLGATVRSNPPPPPQQPLNNLPPQQSDRGRGGRYIPASGNRNTNSNAPVRIAPRYELFFPIQAHHLDALAKDILAQITPPPGETEQKRKLLAQLEQLCKELISSARLIPFGSLVTGFATASSDIDCIFSPIQVSNNRYVETPHVIEGPTDAEKKRLGDNPDYPLLLAQLLEKNGFQVLLLSKTRVPIIKLKRAASDSHPELNCDIGFKNSLAVHNTALLKTYSECDERVKPLVLFIKWWAKRRCINTPYLGTLCSYGYVLMILHYLINVVQPPVLPNLQDIPPPATTHARELSFSEDGGDTDYFIWFAKNLSELPRSKNTSSLGELIRGFFDYYSFKFAWGNAVISIRSKGGLKTKQEKEWTTANIKTAGGEGETENTFQVKNRYLVAIEDPFETTHNVGRTCTGKGLNTIRSEFRRAMDKIKTVSMAQEFSIGSGIYELCEQAPVPERQERQPRRPLSMESTGGPAPTAPDNLAETTGSSAESSTDSAPPTPKASTSTTAVTTPAITTPTEKCGIAIDNVAEDNIALACSALKDPALQNATIDGDLADETRKLDIGK